MKQLADLFKSALRSGNDEGCQLLIMAVGTFAFVLALAAIAIDGGLFAQTKRDLQNDVDAMVLAAVREMPDTSAAATIAATWASQNGVDAAEIVSVTYNVDCDGSSSPDSITISLARIQQTFLAQVMGITEATLNVCASARTGYAQAGPGLLPFGLLEEDSVIANVPPVCYLNDNDFFWDQTCVIKIPQPSETWTPGNSGPLRLDDVSNVNPTNYAATCDPPGSNSGADEYTENIVDGSECSYAPGDEVQTFTGSLVGPTCDAIDELLGANIDTFDDVFADADGDGVYEIVDTSSPRYILIPVVSVPEGSAGSSTNVTIKTFVTAYLSGCNGGLGADPASVELIPVKSKVFLNGIDFVEGVDPDYATDWPLYTIKLIS